MRTQRRKTIYWVASGCVLLAMLVGLVASLVLGGCDTLIPAETGPVPMKCHWAFIATAAVFVLGIVVSIGQFLLKTAEARRFAAVVIILIALVVAFLPSPWGIGICSNDGMMLCALDGMDCHTTAPIVWACAALLVVCSGILLATADPDAARKPRLRD
jgi:hypothetical protein